MKWKEEDKKDGKEKKNRKRRAVKVFQKHDANYGISKSEGHY